MHGDVPVIRRSMLDGCSASAPVPRAGALRQQYGNRWARKDKGVSRHLPANPRLSWLPDLGSNQGPTD